MQRTVNLVQPRYLAQRVGVDSSLGYRSESAGTPPVLTEGQRFPINNHQHPPCIGSGVYAFNVVRDWLLWQRLKLPSSRRN